MNTSSDFDSPASELDLDLHFLPAWAQKPPTENRYAKYEGSDELERTAGWGNRPGRREGRRPIGGHRPGGDRRGGGEMRPRREERKESSAPPLELTVSFIPEEKGVESLARQIRLTGRAYPLFDIAFLILKKPERYHVQILTIKKADGQPAQPLLVCSLDETLWIAEAEAVAHVLSRHFETFYQPEKTPSEPPKGTYTFVAQCGMSGEILGPPNYHDYQNKLRRLHAERFPRVPFDVFKSRVKIVKDEAVVKKWLEDQSWKTEYICLNVPEPLKLSKREDVEKHFREVHLANIIRPVESHTLSGTALQQSPNSALKALVRGAWDEQMRFPLKVVNILSQQFAGHGLQFFKVKKSITHVAVARPRYLDLELTPVSEGVKRIVDFIRVTPNCTRRKLVEALAPVPPEVAGNLQAEAPPTPEVAALVSDLHWLVHQGHVIEFASGHMELAKKPVPIPVKPKPAAPPAAKEAAAQTEAVAELPSEGPAADRHVADGEANAVEATVQPAGGPTTATASAESAAHSPESGEITVESEAHEKPANVQ